MSIRIQLLFLIICSSSLASASTTQSCKAIPNDIERLACYDSVYGAPPREREDTAESDRERSSATDNADKQAVAKFGIESVVRAKEKTKKPSEIIGVISTLDRQPHGEWLFGLENGQVWVQLEADRSSYRKGTQITIKRTPFGSYQLFSKKGRRTRVKRIK